MTRQSRINQKPPKRKKRRPKKLKWLIYCNGKTERLYIQSLIEYLELDKGILDVKVLSTDSNTLSLIREANLYYGTVYPHNTYYDRIFCVYDRDSFVQFGDSVALGESYGYDIIWSNECFELWFMLHFKYFEEAHPRTSYFDELTEIFRKNNVISKGQNYKRHASTRYNIFDIITNKTGGNFDKAIEYADKLYCKYSNGIAPAAMNPATKVHILISELKQFSDCEAVLLPRLV